MSADDLLNNLTYALYIAVFLTAIWRLARRPTRANLDVALLFGATTAIIAISLVAMLRTGPLPPIAEPILSTILMALPYLTLRLVDDFAGVRPIVMRLAEGGLLLSAAALFTLPTPLPGAVALAMVGYFLVVESYAALMFVRQARYSNGITRRRMQSIAAGSLFVGLVIFIAGIQFMAPESVRWTAVVSHLCGLASGVFYSLGFTPPAFLRRAWHEPELRAFLARSVHLSPVSSRDETVQELEWGAAATTGAPHATIGIWDETKGVLRYRMADSSYFEHAPEELMAGRAFTRGQPVFSSDARRDDPAHARIYEATGAVAVLAAPISRGEKQLGVLAIYAPRAPIFAEDDLTLVQLLADQAGLILESHSLQEEAALMQAREETARLKEDFLSSAAHDLKSPLTGILGLAQVIELRALRQPETPADPQAIQRIIGEARRMSRLVTTLLDGARAESSRLIGAVETVDLSTVAREVCDRRTTELHPCILDATGPVVGTYDRLRIEQLLENLVENAAKYSPQGCAICVEVWREGDEAHLTVTDQGIGIPPEDLPKLFDRFHRGSNVDDRRFVGMGLGLYICRRIAEQHGGSIQASSPGPSLGTTVHVTLPALAARPAPTAGDTGEPQQAVVGPA